nr:putative serine/threonine-protein kinase haspin like [Quercus suber]
MPRQQVYGKQSRANLDAVAIFADNSSSPSREAQNHERIKNGSRPDQTYRNTKDSRQTEKEASGKLRKALNEVSVNSVAVDGCHGKQGTIRRRPKETRIKRPETNVALSTERYQVEKSPTILPSDLRKPECNSREPAFEEQATQAERRDGTTVSLRIQAEPTTIVNSADIVTCSANLQQRNLIDASKDEYAAYAAPLLSLSTHGMTCFSDWTTQLSSHFDLTKIAEASYGEVYRLSSLPSLLIPGFTRADESVLKIMALQAPPSTLPKDKRKRAAALRKQEAMSKVEDVANEVRLLQRMSSIPGFTNFRDVRVMRGRPPPAFIEAFQNFNTSQKVKGKELSVFPNPAKKTSYSDDQLWAVIEMQDAGTDLERCVEDGQVTGIWAIWDVFWQVVLTLGKGEEAAEFEHRDLHLGNICIRPTATPSSGKPARSVGHEIDLKKNLNFSGLETTIIDYTLSRAIMGYGSATTITTSPASKRTTKTPPPPSMTPTPPEIAFHDLAHPSNAAIFEADSTHEYQYDIYRFMRTIVEPPPPSQPSAPTPWSSFHPRTNLVWLHFLLHKLLTQPSLTLPSTACKPAAPTARRAHKRAKVLEARLRAVQDLLRPEVLMREAGAGEVEVEVQGSRDLVALALGEGWLGVRDVVDCGGGSGGLQGGEGEKDGEDEEVEELVDALAGLGIEMETAKAGDDAGADVAAGAANGEKDGAEEQPRRKEGRARKTRKKPTAA